MRIKQSEFITSAVKREQYPIDNRVEVAFVGRSNVVKKFNNKFFNKQKKISKS
jgi:GTP-binding protein